VPRRCGDDEPERVCSGVPVRSNGFELLLKIGELLCTFSDRGVVIGCCSSASGRRSAFSFCRTPVAEKTIGAVNLIKL
jgi:hypothetical protein